MCFSQRRIVDARAHRPRLPQFSAWIGGRVSLEFDKGRKSVAVAVKGPITVDDVDVTIRAAVDGAGLAFALEEHVAAELANGTLVRVLDDWCQPFTGYFLYYPSRRQQPPALSALIETFRL